MEFAERAVIRRHLAFALHHVNFHRGLIVRRRRKCFRLARGYCGVPRNQHSHHAAQRFHAQRERGHVQQQDVLHFAAQHAALNRRPHRDYFIRIDALVRLLPAEQIFHDLHHPRYARGAAHQHHFVYLVRRYPRVGKRLLGRPDGALQDVFH